MRLLPRLIAEIEAEGPLTVARFMDLCLHDPTAGYYATRPALGAEGDFLTAPLVSQMFGELLGLWCAETWRAMGSPPRFRWIELGPGDATLMSDMRRAVARAAPVMLEAAETVLVETSEPLRARQAETLAGAGSRWVSNLVQAAGGGRAPVLIVGNEFVDCLPARQFVRTSRGWAERRVGLSAERALCFGLGPAPADFAAPPGLADAPPGSVIEISAAQAALGAEIGACVTQQGGAAILIDYGRDRAETGDTLQALVRHARVDPLAFPGDADLTVHVDFAAVAAAARGAGAGVTPVVGQGVFLRALGIEDRAAALASARADKADVLKRQVARLTTPEAMGELFKVLAIHAPGLALPGLETAP